MEKYTSSIVGHLDIICVENKAEYDVDEVTILSAASNEILIHGDPAGFRSLANLLLKIADFNQEAADNLLVGAREHIHLRPNYDLSYSSVEVIVGRLDAKGTGDFYSSYIAAKK